MATLTDLLNKVKKTIKDYTPLDELASSVRSYFNPTSNQGQNFWSTPVAYKLGEIQQSLEQRTLPTVNLTQYAKGIKEPVPRFGAELGLGIAENILNIPQRLAYGGARAGQDVRTVLGAGRITPGRAIGTAAEVALPLIDIYTLGGGTLVKGLGKQAIKQVAQEGLKSTIKRTAIKGGVLGTGYGTLSGAAEGDEAKLGNVLKNATVGGLLGVTVGGTVGGIGGILGLIKRSPRVEKELIQRARNQPRNLKTGEWVTTNLEKPKGMTKAQWEFQLEFNKKYGRNPYTPVYPSDLKKAIEHELSKKQGGLSIRDINKDVSPFEESKVKSAIPPKLESLAVEARKYKSAEEFANKYITKDYVAEVKPTKLGTKGSSVFKTAGEARMKGTAITEKEIEIAKRDQKIFNDSKGKSIEQLEKEIADSKKFADKVGGSYPRSIQVKQDIINQKSQLTDLYNQATRGLPKIAPKVAGIPQELEPLAVEARKYKSAEEFRKIIHEAVISKERTPEQQKLVSQIIRLNTTPETRFGKLTPSSIRGEAPIMKGTIEDFYNQATGIKGATTPPPTTLPVGESRGEVGKIKIKGGLSIRDINKDVSPFEEPKAGLPKPEPFIRKFFNQDRYNSPHITKSGEYVNPHKNWLLKEKFVPPKLKEVFGKEANIVKGELDSSSIWPKENPQPLKLAGYLSSERGDPLYVLKLPSGQNIAINKYYYDYLNKHIPNFRLGGFAPKRPLVIFSGNEKAGLVMPVTIDEGMLLSKIQPIKGIPEVKPISQEVPSVSVPPVSEKVSQGEVPLGHKLSQQVEKATKPAGQTVELPKEQPIMGGGQGIPPSEPIIPPGSDPVQKVIQALKEAKPLRGKQEKIYSQIRSKQAGAIAGIGQEMKGEQTFFKQKGQLKGELPKVQFESIRSKLKQEDIDALFNKVEQSPLTPFEKIHAKEGLAKLLGAEGGVVPQKSEMALLNEIFPPEFIQQVLNKRPFLQKLFSSVEEGLNLPRAVMATADLSAPLRQGIFLIGRPKQWIPAFGNMFKYAFSENAYKGLFKDIRSRPTYQVMREAKLALTDISPILQGREETFMSNLVERIPIFGRIARGSNRAYSGFLNKLRADVFDDLYKNAKNLGVLEERPKVAEDIAKFVNSATGRGDLGALNRAAVVLNGVFFSPRLMASRINLLNPYYYMKLDPFVRKEALKLLFTFAGTALTTLTLAKLGGAEIGTDPRSANFGKIKIGNTRYDILGGFQQYIKLASQLITGKLISSTTGKEYTLGEGYKPLTRWGILGRFFESKEAPFASFVKGLLQGQNTLGQPFNIPTEVVNRFIPMIISDMYDIAKDKNSPLAAIMATPGIFGVGVQTYGKQVPNLEFTPTGKPKVKLSPVGGLAEDIVRKFTGQPESNLPAELQQPLVQKIQSEQQKKIEMDKIKQQAEKGDLTQKGNYIPIITNEGVKVIDLSFQPTPPVLTGNAELDKKAISKFNGEITKKANDIYDLYQAGEISAQEAEQELLKLKELKELKAKTGKVKVGGKKIKIARPPTLKIKQVKPAKIKTTSLKVKVARPRRVAALKIAKPKAQTVNIRIPKQTYQPIPIRFGGRA